MGNCLPLAFSRFAAALGIDRAQSTSTQAAPAGATAAERIPPSRGHSFPCSSTFSVLQRVSENCKQLYKLGVKLGEGGFGTTYLCIERSSGSRYACKCIRKCKLTSREKENVRREVRIMHHLSGHPHIVGIRDAYEDCTFVYLVMELCEGGELLDRIIQRGRYSEREAAHLIRTIVSVVESCHSLGVMHRDLKLENFLFSDKQEASPLKAIDFGISVFFKPGEIFQDSVGTPIYVAPEVLQNSYGPQADIWSAGVILYILLCGKPPFSAYSEQGIFERVLLGVLDFKSNPWPRISESAKDLIKNMLNLNPQARFTAYQVLCHPWICEDGVAPDRPLDPAILSRMKQFMAMNKMKKIALRIIAQKCSEEEIAGLKEAFKMIDADGNGTITFDELKDGLQRMGSSLHDNEVHTLMEAADVDKNGIIDYEEFIAATLNLNQLHKEQNLVAAFKYFDLDGNGLITIDELRQACIEHKMGDAEIHDVIKEIDQNNDGYIDYDEFVSMMQKANGVLWRRPF